MIFDKTACGEIDNNTTGVAYPKVFVFRCVAIGGKDNKYSQFTLNVFYKDVYELKNATVLRNFVNWSNNETIRCNDNAFVFNRMIGNYTVF